MKPKNDRKTWKNEQRNRLNSSTSATYFLKKNRLYKCKIARW